MPFPSPFMAAAPLQTLFFLCRISYSAQTELLGSLSLRLQYPRWAGKTNATGRKQNHFIRDVFTQSSPALDLKRMQP